MYKKKDLYRQTQSIARAGIVGTNMTLKLKEYSRYGFCEQLEPRPKGLLGDQLEHRVGRPQRRDGLRDHRRLEAGVDARHGDGERAVVAPLADVVGRERRREGEEAEHVLGAAAARRVADVLVRRHVEGEVVLVADGEHRVEVVVVLDDEADQPRRVGRADLAFEAIEEGREVGIAQRASAIVPKLGLQLRLRLCAPQLLDALSHERFEADETGAAELRLQVVAPQGSSTAGRGTRARTLRHGQRRPHARDSGAQQ